MMVLLNSIKTAHFPIIHCFYWTPSQLNRIVLLNAVNFWKGSNTNEILLLMFWEYSWETVEIERVGEALLNISFTLKSDSTSHTS